MFAKNRLYLIFKMQYILMIKINKKELFIISLKIAAIEIVVEGVIMFVVLPFMEPHLNEFASSLFDPLLLAAITSPIIAGWVIRPYVFQRDKTEKLLIAAQKEAREEHAAKEKILHNLAGSLKEAVANATQKLKISEERYALAARGTNDGLWDWNVTENTIYFSPRLKEIFELELHKDINKDQDWFSKIHNEDYERVLNLIEKSKTAEHETNFSCEYRIYSADQKCIWLQMRWIAIVDSKNNSIRLVGAQTDISDRKRLESRLIHEAFHDTLTGLPNRNLFYDRLNQALKRFKRSPSQRFVFLLIDIDNFKRVNDTLGHSVGDYILTQISNVLRRSVREIDTVARLGGDEFAILLTEFQSQDHLESFLNRLLSEIAQPIPIQEGAINPSVSMGVVIASKNHRGANAERVFADADLALYTVKDRGKGNFMLFNPEMRESISRQFEISNSLKGALARGEISLFYQPIVNVKEDKVIGFEALMRWNHPQKGWIPPSNFVPIAEESDVIYELGRYAIQSALKQLHLWNSKFNHNDWFMSINVSGKQFDDAELISCLTREIHKNKILPHQVKIEITESVLLTYSERIAQILHEIKKMGVKLSIDDFGTGYSSLSTFYQYPFDTIKIDKAFLSKKKNSKEIIDLIQTLAQTLNMETIGEGVEDQSQLALLTLAKCNNIQGFIFSKPLPAEDIELLLNSNKPPSNWHNLVLPDRDIENILNPTADILIRRKKSVSKE